MAIFHFSCKTHNRAGESAKNAVRAAAYRAGATLLDSNTGKQYSYTSKDEVVFSEILAPRNAPEWVADRQRLWSEVEKSEKRIDATLFRDVDLALPNEFDQEQCKTLMRDYITRVMTADGIIVDYAVHWHEDNKHAHLMMTTREISGEGFGKKNRDWDSKKFLHKWRSEWSKCVNEHLNQAGFSDRVDHRSLKAQGLDREPTIHVGPERSTTQKIVHERKRRNRRIRSSNKAKEDLEQAGADVARCEVELLAAQQEVAKAEKVGVIKVKMLQSLKPVVKPEAFDDFEVVKKEAEQIEQATKKAKILNSLKPKTSTSTAMVVYQAPKLELGTTPGLNTTSSFNLPSDPIEAQRCYALRELLGRKADEEYNNRRKACAAIGMHYDWSAYYSHVSNYRDKKHGADLSWWRAMARYTVDRKNEKLALFLALVPEQFRENVEEVARQALIEKVEAAQKASGVAALINAQPPPKINTGQSDQPKVEVEKPNVPEPPKPDELSDYYVEPSEIPPRLQVNEEAGKNSDPYADHPYRFRDTPSPW